jgi:hypothetical protein
MPTAAEDATQPSLKARDLLKLAGLTYRQLNDWEHRAGVLEAERATSDGWRRFSWEEALALCICADLRRQFAIPLKSVGPLYLWLAGKEPNAIGKELALSGDVELWELEHGSPLPKLRELRGEAFADAMKDERNRRVLLDFIAAKLNSLGTRPVLLAMQMARFGLPAYLCTTFEMSLILQERNFVRWASTRAVRKPTIVVPLNARIDEFREAMELPSVGLDTILPSFEECWADLRQGAGVSEAERQVLHALREQSSQQVVVHTKDGEPRQMDVHEQFLLHGPSLTAGAIADVVRERAHQTVEVIVKDGRPVTVRRKTVTKLSSTRGTHPKR